MNHQMRGAPSAVRKEIHPGLSAGRLHHVKWRRAAGAGATDEAVAARPECTEYGIHV